MINEAATDTINQGEARPFPGFAAGLIAGGIIGGVLALAFAPRAGADLRRSVTGAARTLGATAAERCHDASARVGQAVEQVADRAQAVRDDVADAAGRFATSLKS